MASYSAPRATDFDTAMRSAFAADANGGTVEVGRGDLLDVLFAVLANELGNLGEALQSLNDQLDPDSAQGTQLDGIGALRGIARNQATHSTATVTLTGTAGTVIPQGKIVEGGGTDGAARWALTDDATIGGGGTVSATVQAVEAGAVAALATEIDTIVTPVSGWTAVSNAAAATAGRALETDSAYRLRQAASLQFAGSGSTNAIRAALTDLDYIDTAIVIENDTAASVTTGGVNLDPQSIAIILDPPGADLTTAQKEEIAETVYERLAAGIKTNGSDNVVTITGGDGLTKTVRWDDVADLSVTVAVTVVLDTGYVLADVSQAVKDAVAAYFADAAIGEEITDDDLKAGRNDDEDDTAIMRVTGVRRVSAITLNGAAVVTPNLYERCTLNGTASVTT
jgi:uncharacterized phage protein gp47/JayE